MLITTTQVMQTLRDLADTFRYSTIPLETQSRQMTLAHLRLAANLVERCTDDQLAEAVDQEIMAHYGG